MIFLSRYPYVTTAEDLKMIQMTKKNLDHMCAIVKPSNVSKSIEPLDFFTTMKEGVASLGSQKLWKCAYCHINDKVYYV